LETAPKSPSDCPQLSELTRMTDDQLMANLKADCHDALTILFTRYKRLVFSIALRIVRDRGEAEDVMQNVFLEIFRSATQFDPTRGTTKVWLLQYAYHRAISRREYLNTRRFYHQEEPKCMEEILPEGSAMGKLTSAETGRLLDQGLLTLSEPQRRVIVMAAYEGFSMNEIAEKTQESLVNVRNHYYRGLRKLRSFVEGPADQSRAAAHE
jgi:RNA polymerase sigma-70 factor (ECF subfamily)